jgi:glutathione S-transferase
MNAYLQGYYFPRTADGQPDRISIEKTWPDVRTYIDLFNRAVTDTSHLVGADFTYADMNLLPILAYLRECPESAREIAPRSPALSTRYAVSMAAGILLAEIHRRAVRVETPQCRCKSSALTPYGTVAVSICGPVSVIGA